MKTLVFVLASLLLVTGMIIAPSQAAEPSQGIPAFAKFIGGTIESLDPSTLKVTIMTDVGKKESLPVADLSVLADLNKGDRVSCEMDDQGLVRKIVKTTDPKGSPAPDPKG
jgi:Cu/Ag efflux protein CusF